MAPDEVAAVLRANEGKRVRLTYDDGAIEWVDVDGVDDEGVLHSGPNGLDPRSWWTRFESITRVEVANE